MNSNQVFEQAVILVQHFARNARVTPAAVPVTTHRHTRQSLDLIHASLKRDQGCACIASVTRNSNIVCLHHAIWLSSYSDLAGRSDSAEKLRALRKQTISPRYSCSELSAGNLQLGICRSS